MPVGVCPSDQAETLVLLHGLCEATAEDVFGLVAGHVQQVVAGVGHRQVVLLRRGGLDHDVQALHAMDRNPVAAGEEHWRRYNNRNTLITMFNILPLHYIPMTTREQRAHLYMEDESV